MLVSASVNSYVTHSQARREPQIPDKTEGSLLLSLQIENSSNIEGTTPDATASPNLSQILDIHQNITLNDAGQHSVRMRYYFHYQCNCFIHYFDDPVPDGAVIHAGDFPFQYKEQEGTYTDFCGNPTGYIFLAVSRDHKFLI